ncbi:hypothetical protein J8281_15055 [Aquimarina sp. U1-2]|uniref:hypothetical protein n=1 Tax=Aquimarina sp. U1-2 TaxID=2823141 RepID=UPI001AECDBB7|nr:hypothetical protein [Aquimarina sp. U1-2]MBP2833512.1 hypothetical protein [Aquimarina sp. U1-2]
MTQVPLINGQRHSWSSIEVNVLDRIVTGITAISYDDAQVKENHYGAGDMPVFRGRGKYEAKASLTLYNYEVEAIQKALPKGKRLQDVPIFDVKVSFLDETDDVITHVIRNCEFKTNKRDMKQGDTKVEVQLDLIVSHIEWN